LPRTCVSAGPWLNKPQHLTTLAARADVAHDMLDFMLDFLNAHPELADNDLYITGESYAGHYVPAVAHRLWQWNKGGGRPKINLKGFAIGARRGRQCERWRCARKSALHILQSASTSHSRGECAASASWSSTVAPAGSWRQWNPRWGKSEACNLSLPSSVLTEA
jgi:carboxypeptidase C (cathepsin A)